MLLLLISLFTICAFSHNIQAKPADSSKTPLSEQMHKSVHEIDALLKDLQLEIRKEKSVLRSVDQEIKDIGLLDYSITPVWWGGSPNFPQSDLTEMNAATTPFPIPEGHFTDSTKDPWEKLNLPGLQSNYSPSDPLNDVPIRGPDHGDHLDQTPPTFNPFLASDTPETPFTPYYDTQSASLTRPSYPFFVPPRTPASAPEPYMNYISFDATYSPGSPTFRLPTKTLLPLPAFRGAASAKPEMEGVTMSHLYMKVMRDRTRYRQGGRLLTKANRMKSTQRPLKLGRTLSKAQAWVRNRQWMKTGKPGRIKQENIREGSEKPVENSPAEKHPNLVENTPVQKNPNLVENPPVQKNPNLVENPPVQKNPNLVENPPIEEKPTDVEKSPMEKALDLAKGSPGLDGSSTATLSLETIAFFSMPELTDIIPSMSIPGLDEVTLTTAASNVPVPTTPNILDVQTLMTKAAITAELFQQDEHGFLYVTSPTAIIVPDTTGTMNTLGQILLNAENFTASTRPTASFQGYHEMMETRDEGFLMVFFLELSRLIATKRPEDVAAVVANVEILYNELYEKGSLSYFGEHIMELGTKVSQMFSGSDIGVLRSHANMMHQMLSGRAEFLSVEVNSIIDYADLLYEDDEGESMFEALLKFEAFPNGPLSSRDTCFGLIESFLKPYRRLRSTDRLRKLTDSVTQVVAKKFGNRRSGGVAIPHQNLTRNNNKHIPHSLRHRLETRRHRKNRPRQQQGNRYKQRRQRYATVPILRSMLPITKHQTRFKVITPRQLRTNGYLSLVRPTLGYFKRKLGRPVHPPNGVLQMFPQAKGVKYRQRAQPNEQEKQHLESANHQTLGTMRDEVRRIVEESSYSDEEASLKMNLRHALRVNWHKTSTRSLSK